MLAYAILLVACIAILAAYLYLKRNTPLDSGPNCLVMYVYKEDEQTKENLEFFIKNGIVDNPMYTYVLIVNDYECSVDIPDYVVVYKKDNGYDLESYQEVFDRLGKSLYNYDYFFFINSSCSGPYTSVYNNDWIQTFLFMFDKDVRLVGPIIEVPNDNLGLWSYDETVLPMAGKGPNVPFIHTYMFATDLEGLRILIRHGVFEKEPNKTRLVQRNERLITSCILYEGHNVRSLLLKYKNVDWRDRKAWNFYMWNDPDNPSDPEVPNNYDGIDVTPLEVVFFKNIRNPNVSRMPKYSGIDDGVKKYIERYSKWNYDALNR